jgi:hypothetical protein
LDATIGDVDEAVHLPEFFKAGQFPVAWPSARSTRKPASWPEKRTRPFAKWSQSGMLEIQREVVEDLRRSVY